MACNTGITRVVKNVIGDKGYFTLNDREDFIKVNQKGKLSEDRIAFSAAQSLSNQLNKTLNSSKDIGSVFYAHQYSDMIGVDIAASNKQLDMINDVPFERDINYFNGDRALMEQETNNSSWQLVDKYLLSLPYEKEILRNASYIISPNIRTEVKSSSESNITSGSDSTNLQTAYGARISLLQVLNDANTPKDQKLGEAISYIQSSVNDLSTMVGKVFSSVNPRILIAKEDSTNSIMSQYQNDIIINPSRLFESLYEDNDFSKLPEFLDKALIEELIHIKAYQKLTPTIIDTIYSELSKQDVENIKKYYDLNTFDASLNKSQIVNEYIRQIVQYQLINTTTEETTSQLYKLTKSAIDFLKSLFQDIINIYNNKQDSVGNKTINEITNELKNAIKSEGIDLNNRFDINNSSFREVNNNSQLSNEQNVNEEQEREELPFIDEEQEQAFETNNVIDENLVDPILNQKFEEMLKNGIITEICN